METVWSSFPPSFVYPVQPVPLFDLKSNLLRWRLRQRRWVNDVHHSRQNIYDGYFVDVQAFLEFLFKFGQLADQLLIG